MILIYLEALMKVEVTFKVFSITLGTDVISKFGGRVMTIWTLVVTGMIVCVVNLKLKAVSLPSS